MYNNTKSCHSCGKSPSKLTFIKLPSENTCVFICDECLPKYVDQPGYQYKGTWRGKQEN